MKLESGQMAKVKKTLGQLAESVRHSYDIRLIVNAQRITTNQTQEICEFIACVPLSKKDECQSLQRRGRDPLTTILVRNVWSSDEMIKSLLEGQKEIPKELRIIAESEQQKFCFCDCVMSIRNPQPKRPPR